MPFSPALDEKQRQALVVDYEDGFSPGELVERYGVSPRTVHRILADAEVPKVYKARSKRKKRKRKPIELKPCGTNAAYRRHKRHGEYPCVACVEAHNLDQQGRRSN